MNNWAERCRSSNQDPTLADISKHNTADQVGHSSVCCRLVYEAVFLHLRNLSENLGDLPLVSLMDGSEV